MRILITGGTGFLGRHLVWRLAADGHEVVFTGRNAAAADAVRRHAPASARLLYAPLHHGDADNGAALKRLAAGATAVVHCAALSAPWGRAGDFESANVTSTRQVLEACCDNAIQRLVHISTPSVYFDYHDRLDIREDAPLPAPVNRYAATKRRAEELVQASAVPERVILRPRALFGPWDNTLMPRLLRAISRGAVPMPRSGKALLDVTYIDNAVDAVYLALTRPIPRSPAVYNVSNGEPVPLAALLAMASAECGLRLRTLAVPYPVLRSLAWLMELTAVTREPLLTRYSAGVLAFSQTLDIDAIKRELGYAPRVSVREGMQRYGAWLRQQEAA